MLQASPILSCISALALLRAGRSLVPQRCVLGLLQIQVIHWPTVHLKSPRCLDSPWVPKHQERSRVLQLELLAIQETSPHYSMESLLYKLRAYGLLDSQIQW